MVLNLCRRRDVCLKTLTVRLWAVRLQRILTINPAVGCHYCPPDRHLSSQLHEYHCYLSAPNYTAGNYNNIQQPFYGPLSRTSRVSRYQKKHSPTHHPDHHPIFISFFHLPRSTASSLFKLRAWQSFCTTSFHVLFGLPLGLEPSTSYSIHFFIQSVSSFRSTCPYHRNLFCCSINIISSIPSLSLNSLLGSLSFTLTLTVSKYNL